MKRRKPIIWLALMMAFTILACQVGGIALGRVRGSGNVVEETRAVSGVTGVQLATLGQLMIEVGDRESLRIEAEDNLIEHLETEVRDGTLRIRTPPNVSLDATKPVKYYLTVTGLEAIEISSSGGIQAPDLVAERFSVKISSSGNLEMGDLETGGQTILSISSSGNLDMGDVAAEALTVNISSTGNLTMGVLNANVLEVDMSSNGNLDIAGGEVQSQNVSISSSANYLAQNLACDQAEVRLTSSGSATLWVRDRLTADLTSSGDVRYRGDPTVDATTSSSGEVVKIGE